MVQFLERAISRKEKIVLDGKNVFPSLEQSGTLAIVEDFHEEFRVRFVRDPNVAGVYGRSAFCTRQTKNVEGLRLIGTNGMTHAQYNAFVRGIVYEVDDVQRLVSKVIPELKSVFLLM